MNAGCCGCCHPDASEMKAQASLWEDGELLPAEVEPYKARLSEVSHVPQVINRTAFILWDRSRLNSKESQIHAQSLHINGSYLRNWIYLNLMMHVSLV